MTRVTVRYFGILRELAGKKQERIEIDERAPISKLVEEVARTNGAKFRDFVLDSKGRPRRSLAFAADGDSIDYAGLKTKKCVEISEFVILPPISGGSDGNAGFLVVSAEVLPGMEDEFNKWYDEHHIPNFSGKMPHVKSIRRLYSKRSDPHFLAIYEFANAEEMKESLGSSESKAAGDDADSVVGKYVSSFTYKTYLQVYPK